mmetsp:Transcript_26757/g.41853  ORF Transcript_26757/g.41853 Transcript_26757/m.41853 type:complete len:99 (+) Transcript_26757:1575-1871(+)
MPPVASHVQLCFFQGTCLGILLRNHPAYFAGTCLPFADPTGASYSLFLVRAVGGFRRKDQRYTYQTQEPNSCHDPILYKKHRPTHPAHQADRQLDARP